MKCPKCLFSVSVKDGIVKGRQRYKCKECGYRYTVEIKKKGLPSHIKRIAIILSLEGYSLQQIADEIGVSHTSVANWLKSDSLEGLLKNNVNRKWGVFTTNKEGLRASLNEKQFKKWMLICWNSIESKVYLAKSDRSRGRIGPKYLPSSNRRKHDGQQTELRFLRELLNEILIVAQEPAEYKDELQSLVKTFAEHFDDAVRNLKVEGA